MAEGSPARKGDILVLVGTRKGAFILNSGSTRKSWKVSGPYHAGSEVFHVTYDPRVGTVIAAVNNFIWGPDVQRSADLGEGWSSSTEPPTPSRVPA